jgi:hypothetical protein
MRVPPQNGQGLSFIGAAVGLLVFGRWQEMAIEESRERLTDESHRKALLSLGIATGSPADLKGSPREQGRNLKHS